MARSDLLLLPWLLAACTFVTPSPCHDEACPGDYACDEKGYCLDSCRFDDDCISGTLCDDDVCVEECEDEDCGGGYVCDDNGLDCRDRCSDDDECQSGWKCCTAERFIDGKCDDSSACYEK